MIDVDIRYSPPAEPSAELVARLRDVLRGRKRVARAYIANRTIYEAGHKVQDNKVGLAVELSGWFGRRYLEELRDELAPVLNEHLREHWSSMANDALPEVREVGALVFERERRR